MTVEEIMHNRELMAYRLVQNLRKYGNLEPAGFNAGRPTQHRPLAPDKKKQVVYFGKSNYLRLEASLTPDTHKNPCYIQYDEIKATGNTVRKGAKSISFELWTETPAGKFAELKPYYNIEDVEITHDPQHKLADILAGGEFLIEAHDRDEDKARLEAYLHLNELKEHSAEIRTLMASDLPYNVKLAQVAEDAAMTGGGLDEIAARFYAQLTLKEFHISQPFDSEHPLFDESEIAQLEKEPRKFIAAINDAQNYLRNYDISRVLAAGEQIAAEPAQNGQGEVSQLEPVSEPTPVSEPEPEYDGPFKGLVVTVTLASTVYNPDTGKDMFSDIGDVDSEHPKTFVGEDAYKFLMMVNARDKAMFDGEWGPRHDDGKLTIKVQYGDYEANGGEGMRSDLGALMFGNRTSVAEMLNYRLTLVARNAFDQSLEHLYLVGEHKDWTVKELHDQAFTQIREVAEILKPLAEEETVYLEAHPEYKTINARQAKPYMYIISKAEAENNRALEGFGIVPREEVKDYVTFPAQVTEKLMQELTLPDDMKDKSRNNPARDGSPYLERREAVPDDMVVIKSPVRPDMVHHDALLVMPYSDVEALRALRGLELTSKRTYNMDGLTPKEISPQKGIFALGQLGSVLHEDNRVGSDGVYNKYFDYAYAETEHIKMTYNGETIPMQGGVIGYGTLSEYYQGKDFLHIKKDHPDAAKVIYKGMAVYDHYAKTPMRYTFRNPSKDCLPLPTVAESKAVCLQNLADFKNHGHPEIRKLDYIQGNSLLHLCLDYASCEPSNNTRAAIYLDAASALAVTYGIQDAKFFTKKQSKDEYMGKVCEGISRALQSPLVEGKVRQINSRQFEQ